MSDTDNELERLIQERIKSEEALKAAKIEEELKHQEKLAFMRAQPQVDQFAWKPEPVVAPLEANPQSVLGNMRGIREQATQKDVADLTAAKNAFMTGVKIEKAPVASSSVSPDMLAEAQSAISKLKGHDEAMTELRREINTFPAYTSLKTISSTDPRLSIESQNKEMAKDERIVNDRSKANNFFENTRSFDFGGKMAHEARASSIEKKDYQAWLNTFQPAAKSMADTQRLEINTIPNDATDAQIKAIELKHKFEQDFFKAQEKNEYAKAEKLFPNEFTSAYVKGSIKDQPATKKEIDKVHEAFKDYTAAKLGETWRTEFVKDEPSLARTRALFQKLDSKPQTSNVVDKIKVMRQNNMSL